MITDGCRALFNNFVIPIVVNEKYNHTFQNQKS